MTPWNQNGSYGELGIRLTGGEKRSALRLSKFCCEVFVAVVTMVTAEGGVGR